MKYYQSIHPTIDATPISPIDSTCLSFQHAPGPGKGVYLVAHPLIPGPLHRTVVLLLDYNTTSSKGVGDNGVYGLLFNRPGMHSLRSAVKNLPESLIKVLCRVTNFMKAKLCYIMFVFLL